MSPVDERPGINAVLEKFSQGWMTPLAQLSGSVRCVEITATSMAGKAHCGIAILDRLNASTGPQDMNLPGYRFHELIGKYKSIWSVWVAGDWRVTFQFDGQNVINVDYQDYH